MTELIKKHPELKKPLTLYPELKTFKVLRDDGKTEEFWEKNQDGHWVDQTVREQLREKIAEEKEELERLLRAEKRQKAKEAKEAKESKIVEETE